MEQLTKIAQEYKNVISAWRKRADVQNGEALAYRKNQSLDGEFDFGDKPKNLGEGTTTTGWCVSVSQNFLNDPIFQILLQSRQAKAKLVSIDIKEQHYGHCYTGSQNKWHTAILVQDSGINFIIDLTCGQFGNAYVNKNIWDFVTWEKTFRSPLDRHNIVDFENNQLSVLPVEFYDVNQKETKMLYDNYFHDITTITDMERTFLSDFFIKQINTLNKKLLIGNITDLDFKYMNQVNKLLENFNFSVSNDDEKFLVMQFANKQSALNWTKKLLLNKSDDGFVLPQYLLFSNSLKDSCKYNGIDIKDVHGDNMSKTHYIVIKLKQYNGIDISMIPYVSLLLGYGVKIIFNADTDIYNSGKELAVDFLGNTKKTNTIVINCWIY